MSTKTRYGAVLVKREPSERYYGVKHLRTQCTHRPWGHVPCRLRAQWPTPGSASMLRCERIAVAGKAPGDARWQGGVLASLRFFVIFAGLAVAGTAAGETWRGFVVAPEHRCSPCDRKRDYRYPQPVEQNIVRCSGVVYGPCTGICFSSTTDTDIERIVATSDDLPPPGGPLGMLVYREPWLNSLMPGWSPSQSARISCGE